MKFVNSPPNDLKISLWYYKTEQCLLKNKKLPLTGMSKLYDLTYYLTYLTQLRVVLSHISVLFSYIFIYEDENLSY